MTTAHSRDGQGPSDTSDRGTDGQGSPGWTAAVRQRLGLGRLLPSGGPSEGIWVTEQAATAELRRAAVGVPGASLGGLWLSPADRDGPGLPVVPPAPGAAVSVPLRIDGEFTATTGEPLMVVAQRLREVLAGAAEERLGLDVAEVDLRITGLVEPAAGPGAEAVRKSAATGPVGGRAAPAKGEAARAAAGVPGVAYLTGTLGTAVTVTWDQVRVEVATAPGHHAPTVARAVREAVTATGTSPVTVLVTAVEAQADHGPAED
ncbi:hypothetical protein OG349_27930 [Streptomyces sp. NBC_01317]|uniref:hypothetical protein n=1 Tax=Streptomyces sp. NBC_01317 TaxID=2903822 RepID=UPI002E12DC8C|nr:hypothetical protein OG349_27930 [Streptomyces sp. NBC_01317]